MAKESLSNESLKPSTAVRFPAIAPANVWLEIALSDNKRGGPGWGLGECLWWRHNGAGYTTDLNEAGRYKGSEIRGFRDTDIPWLISTVLESATLQVDAQHLPARRRSR